MAIRFSTGSRMAGRLHGTLRADLAFSRAFELAASGGVRMFTTEGDRTAHLPRRAHTDLNQTGRNLRLLGATFGSRYRSRDGSLALNTMAEAGEAGHRYGGDISGRKQFDGGYYDSMAVLSLLRLGRCACMRIAARPKLFLRARRRNQSEFLPVLPARAAWVWSGSTP